MQDKIAGKVVSALALRLHQEEKKKFTQRYTENVEAYHQYLKGRHHIGKLTPVGIRASNGLSGHAAGHCKEHKAGCKIEPRPAEGTTFSMPTIE